MSMQAKLYFVIGASGSGKTTIVRALERNYPEAYEIVYFDSIGVPSLAEMHAKYNGPEEWQKLKTFEWVKKIKEILALKINVILDGQTRPKFIEDACNANQIQSYEVVLFDCSDQERLNRLINRGNSELANEQMINWAKYLRHESRKRNYQVIDNTNLNYEETLNHFVKWLKEKK